MAKRKAGRPKGSKNSGLVNKKIRLEAAYSHGELPALSPVELSIVSDGGEMSHDKLSRCELSRDELSHGDLSHSKVSHGDLSYNKLSNVQSSYSELSSGDLSYSGPIRVELKCGELSSADARDEVTTVPVTDDVIAAVTLPHSDDSLVKKVRGRPKKTTVIAIF